MEYKVCFYEDNLYEVRELNPDIDEYDCVVFTGTLADCEAWIRLKEQGYI